MRILLRIKTYHSLQEIYKYWGQSYMPMENFFFVYSNASTYNLFSLSSSILENDLTFEIYSYFLALLDESH